MTERELIIKVHAADGGAYLEPLRDMIRCKGCKWCRAYYHGPDRVCSYECAKLYLTSDIDIDNDFCSRAERR